MRFKRLMAFIIHFHLIAFVSMSLSNAMQTVNSQILTPFLVATMLTLLLCKDYDNGQSVGKRIMKLKVVNEKTNEDISVIKSIIRNIFFTIWEIEILLFLITREKRIGDYVVKTKILRSENTRFLKINIKSVILVLICFSVLFLLLYLIINHYYSPTYKLL